MAWRWHRRRRGRPPKPRRIESPPPRIVFNPSPPGAPVAGEPVYLGHDEYEALRLTYYLGLTQEEAAARMGVSRGTLWRILYNARRKLVQAIVEARPIVIS